MIPAADETMQMRPPLILIARAASVTAKSVPLVLRSTSPEM